MKSESLGVGLTQQNVKPIENSCFKTLPGDPAAQPVWEPRFTPDHAPGHGAACWAPQCSLGKSAQ